ncbi:TPA: ATP-binding protein [Pseudomonas aeruginosa]|nr:ATP-binding protein [Pseudomonas aeruginosa]
MSHNFKAVDFSGSNTITDEGIKNHFKKDLAPWQPIAELIWNGLDANATEVSVFIRRNNMGGVESISVLDNGDGIDFTRPLDNFRRFNDSLKRKSHSMHGSKGRGRLAFHKICNRAIWFTKFKNQDAYIEVESSHLRDIKGTTIPTERQNALLTDMKSGTCVELLNIFRSIEETETLLNQLSLEFGWHLALNPEKCIKLDGQMVVPPDHTRIEKTVSVENEEFKIELLHWSQKLQSEKSYNYLLDSNGNVIFHMPSSLNHKPGYYTSLFISSAWFDAYSSEHTLTQEIQTLTTTKVWKQVFKSIVDFAQEHYSVFLIAQADKQIKELVEQGDFPDYKELSPAYSEWRLDHLKGIVRAIIISDPKLFKNSNKRQRKIIIRLLDRLAVSNENDALLDVLESVLDLDSNAMQIFSDQIKKAKLNNIIKTIETLQKREMAIARISEIMRNHYKETLETPDLQGIIESNTWLFGNQYETIGAEEDTFTKIAERLRDRVNGINEIDIGDLDEGAILEGANRQVDLFLVRRNLQYDSLNKPYFKCVIIEIKRPSIALNKKHLRQIDEYAAILSGNPDFNGINTKYEIVLVGRKISDSDYEINSRLADLADRNEPGLIGSGKIKRYVKTWKTITEEFGIANNFLLGILQTQRDSLENESRQELIGNLQKQTA